MSKIEENFGSYLKALKQIREVVLPSQGNLKSAVRSILKGGSVALAVTAAFTLVLTFLAVLYFQLANIQADFPTVVRGAFAVALSGFGASVSLESGSLFGLGGASELLTIGAHSGLIFVTAFLSLRRVARLKEQKLHDKETIDVSPVHVAIGFTAFSWLVGFISQGALVSGLGGTQLQPLSLTSTLALFVFAWIASYRGQVSKNIDTATAFGRATQWVSRALANFMASYAVVVVSALVVAGIAIAIQPVFAYATEPSSPSAASTSDAQTVLALSLILLFLINSIFQLLLGAMGLNIGMQVDGAGANLLSNLDPLNLGAGKTNFWFLTDVGVLAFIGVLLMVLVLALISGAGATAKTKIHLKDTVNYWQALGYGTLVAFGVTYLMNFQISSQALLQAGVEGDPVSTSVTVGSTFVSVLVFSTIILTLAFLASDKLYNFVASAFPLLAVRIFGGQMPENRSMSGMVFGLTAKLLLIAVVLTPITAATANRVSALTDGPTQVGQTFASNLQNMKIADLKKYLNPNAKTSRKWLSDSILAAAQPTEGFYSSVAVTNFLDKPWTPGNLDAVVEVTLSKDGKSFSYTFDTESEVTSPSWLLTHVNYPPLLSPGELDIVSSKLLPASKLESLTINGKKAKVGKYFSIPGTYTVKADGYKLIAPTNKTFYSSKINSIKLGFNLALPEGGSAKLDKAIQAKAAKCLKVSSAGTGTCVNKNDITKAAVLDSSAVAPAEYFDYRDYNFKSGTVKCNIDDRKDSLVTATVQASSADCEAEITFSRDYYKVAKKKVPNYVTVTTCNGGYLTNGGLRAYYYDDFYGTSIYRDTSGSYWYESSLYYSDCASTDSSTVQKGTKTELIRGSKISTIKMTSTVSRKQNVKGTLFANGDFKVTQ
jgi:hypothetical protein